MAETGNAVAQQLRDRKLDSEATVGSGGAPLDTSANTYVLFLDMREVEDLVLCRQVVNRAKKHSQNPVFGPGDFHDWDGAEACNWGGSLIYDVEDKVFKMWYVGRDVKGTTSGEFQGAIGYAVSEDGVVWHKPKLGLYEFNGRKDNSICFRAPDSLANHFSVVKDPNEPNPQRRYQALEKRKVTLGDVTTARHFPHYSADGVHWNRGGEFVEVPTTADTGYIVIDEDAPPEQRFRAYGQHTCCTGPDIESLKFVGDVISPADGAEHEIHFLYTKRYRNEYPMLYDYNYHRPYYSRPDRRDAGRQEYLHGRMSLERGDLPPEEPDSDYQIYTGDIRLAAARDPLGKFKRIGQRQPVVARGERGEWDSGFLVLGGECFFEHNGQILIFYAGLNETNASAFPGITGGPISTGLATLPIDGFTYLCAEDPISRGTMTTKPIQVKNAGNVQLSINVSHTLPWRDWIEVEILDAKTSRPIPGYGREEARVMEDAARHIVRWPEHATLAGVNASHMRLRFHFYGQARLYSYTFTKT